MRSINILIIFFVFALSKAQSPYFNKFFKLGYEVSQVQNFFKLKDSTFIAFAIVSDSLTGRQDCGFLKIDKQGNELVKKVINFQNTNYAWQDYVYTDMVQINSSSFIKFGVNSNASPINMILSKISTVTLDTLKNKYFSDSFYYYSYGILKLHSNKFFLIGTKTNTVTNDYWPNLIEFDSSFNFTASYDVPLTNSVIVTDAKLNESNKKIILSGYKPGSNQQAALIIIDTLGNYINHIIDSSPITTGYSQVIYSNSDDTYVTIGAKKTGNYAANNLYRLYICKYAASSLTPLWRKTYGKAQMINNLYDAVINPDGSIVASGGYADSLPNMSYSNCNTNGVLLKVNSIGDSLWSRQFDNYGLQPPAMPWDELFKGIEKNSDGSYIACGLPANKPNPKVWVIRIDSIGCFNSSCAPSNVGLNETVLNVPLKIFPNPIGEKLTIEIENNKEIFNVNLSNTVGQKLLEHQTLQSKTELDLKNLPSGVYFLNIKVGLENKVYKIIKE